MLLLALGNDRSHGRRAGGPEQKSFPPLGAKLFFLANSAIIFFLSCPSAWPPYHVVQKQKLIPYGPKLLTTW